MPKSAPNLMSIVQAWHSCVCQKYVMSRWLCVHVNGCFWFARVRAACTTRWSLLAVTAVFINNRFKSFVWLLLPSFVKVSKVNVRHVALIKLQIERATMKVGAKTVAGKFGGDFDAQNESRSWPLMSLLLIHCFWGTHLLLVHVVCCGFFLLIRWSLQLLYRLAVHLCKLAARYGRGFPYCVYSSCVK